MIIVGLILFLVGIAAFQNNNASPWKYGIGTVTTFAFVGSPRAMGLMASVLVANSFQLLISFLYLMYNGLFTCMLLAAEYTHFSSRRKALRVSIPTGQQRSTYYLQLPYRYAIPLLCASGLLHWLISQSIFLVRINIFDINGIMNPDLTITACGYSVLGILCSVLLGGLMMSTLWILGIVRKLDTGMPIARSCSAAISAMCHPLEKDKDSAVLPLMWGCVSEDEQNIGHASFSKEKVKPLIDKKLYR